MKHLLILVFVCIVSISMGQDMKVHLYDGSVISYPITTIDSITFSGGTNCFVCGDSITDPRDGQRYATVQIGNQCWFAQSLNYGSFINNSTTQSDNGVVEKYCYNNDTVNCELYGALYRWTEMMLYAPQDSGLIGTTQGVCPVGWHIPTDEEWKTLELELGMSPTEVNLTGDRGTDQGLQLKEGGTSGMNLKLSGRHDWDESFDYLGLLGIYWTATQDLNVSTNNIYKRTVSSSHNKVSRTIDGGWNGLPVRCIKD